jgi:hypothetical protein
LISQSAAAAFGGVRCVVAALSGHCCEGHIPLLSLVISFKSPAHRGQTQDRSGGLAGVGLK